MRPEQKHMAALALFLLVCGASALASASAAPAARPQQHRPNQPWRLPHAAALGRGGSSSSVRAVDPLLNVARLATCLYNTANVSCIAQYCRPNVVVHGDGVFLPRAEFAGAQWAEDLHREWFAAYSGWAHDTLVAAAAPAARGGGATDVFLLFRWRAVNSGPYRGVPPTGRASVDYGVLAAGVDRAGFVTDVALRRSGFDEERAALLVDASRSDPIAPRRAFAAQPWWIPSRGLQQRMQASARAVIELLNGGDSGAGVEDGLRAVAAADVELVDGTDMWQPRAAAGAGEVGAWLRAWLRRYAAVRAAVTGSAVSANKVFVGFRLELLPPPDGNGGRGGRGSRGGRGGCGKNGGSGGGNPHHNTSAGAPQPAQVDGLALFVFNLLGRATHIAVWRNGAPAEAAEAFIGGGGGGWWQWLGEEGGAKAAATRVAKQGGQLLPPHSK